MPTAFDDFLNSLPTPTHVALPAETNLTEIRKDLVNRGVPDVTINGFSLSGLIQNYAVICTDSLRRGTVAHIQKLEKDIQTLKTQLIIKDVDGTNPLTGRKFREDGEQ